MNQYVPNVSDLVISCQKFNQQFKTLFTLNINTGFIYSRELNRKLTLLKTQENVYRLDAYIDREL